MKIENTINKWHQLLEQQQLQILDDILSEDVVFHSPVLHTPQKGKILTKMYLSAAYHILSQQEFTYVREVLQDNQACLEFQTEIEGIVINGVDLIQCDDSGKITDFKVMIRPLKGLQKLQEKMFELLEKSKQ